MSHAASADESLWPAPAKLNLFLHVTGRRADGYHELQTLFQIVDLADTIAIRVRGDGAIDSVRPEVIDVNTGPHIAARQTMLQPPARH